MLFRESPVRDVPTAGGKGGRNFYVSARADWILSKKNLERDAPAAGVKKLAQNFYVSARATRFFLEKALCAMCRFNLILSLFVYPFAFC